MVGPGWREDLSIAARSLSIGVVGGLVTGLVVGGLGGRIAMFVLRLTSSSSLRGVETDNGAMIGVISFETIFLLMVAAAVGILGGVLYLAIRDWLPRRGRIALAAAFGAIVGGAQLLEPHGLDFTALEPLWLAIALFVAIPAGYGAMTSALIERCSADRGTEATPRWTTFVPLLLLLLLGRSGWRSWPAPRSRGSSPGDGLPSSRSGARQPSPGSGARLSSGSPRCGCPNSAATSARSCRDRAAHRRRREWDWGYP